MAASTQEASGTRWWESLLFSFGLTWVGVGFPTLHSIRYYQLSPLAFLLVLLVYQVTPTLLLFLGERLITRSRGLARALPLFRGILIVSLLFLLFSLYFSLDFLRVLLSEPGRVVISPSPLLRVAAGLGIPLAILGVAIYLLVRLLLRRGLARFVPQYVMVLGVLALGWDGFFFYQHVSLSGWENSAAPGNPSPGSSSLAGPVFILLFDGLGGQALLKDGDIDGERFPNFAALARESAVFTNATSNYVFTPLSVPSMLSGRFLSEGDPCVGTVGVCPTDVLKLLHERGYQVTAYYPELILRCGDALRCRGTPAWGQKHPFRFVARVGLLYLDNVVPARVAGFVPPKRYFEVFEAGFPLHFPLPESFEGIVDEIAQSDTRGHVYYIHVTVPHDPLIFDRQGKRRLPPPRTAGYQQVERAYGEQVEYVDTLLGQFIARLKATGIYDRATIIVTGDHGPKWLDYVAERTTDGPVVELGPGVALIIRQPGERAEVSGVDYQHIDFKPTLLDILGQPTEEGLPGVSAFASQRPDRDKVFFVSPPYLDTLIKWVYQPDTGQWLSVD